MPIRVARYHLRLNELCRSTCLNATAYFEKNQVDCAAGNATANFEKNQLDCAAGNVTAYFEKNFQWKRIR